MPKPRLPFWRSVNIDVSIEHNGESYDWEEHPGIEWWGVEALLCPDNQSAEIVIATASLVRVDREVCTDFVFELDNIDGDLGEIASAISESEDRDQDSFGSSILIATNVIVDRFWRGNRLGPALIFFAADILRAVAVFLTPVALRTRLDASGVCFTDYEWPRPGPTAQKKVKTAWRRAGFRKVDGSVVWIPIRRGYPYDGTNHGELARNTMTKI